MKIRRNKKVKKVKKTQIAANRKALFKKWLAINFNNTQVYEEKLIKPIKPINEIIVI